tara:strand:+ start:279 stop:443 length:165 start_codon:yes stop_codon:yes gene_type:complete
MRPKVGVVDTKEIDERLPDGMLLIEVYPDGQVHVAYRLKEWDTWSPGTWNLVCE